MKTIKKVTKKKVATKKVAKPKKPAKTQRELIISLLVSSKGKSYSTIEIAKHCKLGKSSVRRILAIGMAGKIFKRLERGSYCLAEKGLEIDGKGKFYTGYNRKNAYVRK